MWTWTKTKRVILFFMILLLFSAVYSAIEYFYPRDFGVAGSIDGKTNPLKIEKFEKDNHYYISFQYQQNVNKEMQLVCTKEQYDFMTDGKEYHIVYRENFFNRNLGKILKLDDKPIYYGNLQIALSSSSIYHIRIM